jgi:hypothetical protein
MNRAEHLKLKAEKCRRLAAGTDPVTARALGDLAAECEAELADIKAQPQHPRPPAR